mmetsp:Transcript_20661/g.57608  ORF Transcript_20661/g.57608 Transcript_20661/m.57608 type:complete len:409 (-) Transcript_20661:171-1397(-)
MWLGCEHDCRACCVPGVLTSEIDFSRIVEEAKPSDRVLIQLVDRDSAPSEAISINAEEVKEAGKNEVRDDEEDSDNGLELGPDGIASRGTLRILRPERSVSSRAAPIFWPAMSQVLYKERNQSVIIFDWDDTLFPTSIVKKSGIEVPLPWTAQTSVKPSVINKLKEELLRCDADTAELITAAIAKAHVSIVTLATASWVRACCINFYPACGEKLSEHKVPIVSATDMFGEVPARGSVDKEERQKAFSMLKAKAINYVLRTFYSQYAGQTWKNVLSIGDSVFEREGLLAACAAYMSGHSLSASQNSELSTLKETGLWEKEEDGHFYKVRIKCCKLLRQPDMQELAVQLNFITDNLESMVDLDSGFGFELEALTNPEAVGRFVDVINGRRPPSDLPAVSHRNVVDAVLRV